MVRTNPDGRTSGQSHARPYTEVPLAMATMSRSLEADSTKKKKKNASVSVMFDTLNN